MGLNLKGFDLSFALEGQVGLELEKFSLLRDINLNFRDTSAISYSNLRDLSKIIQTNIFMILSLRQTKSEQNFGEPSKPSPVEAN